MGVPLDPYAPGAVVVISEEPVADAGCDGDSGRAVVTSTSDDKLGLWPIAVIGGEDGHIDGCTPLPWPDMGEYAPFLTAPRGEVALVSRARARRLCGSLRHHLETGNDDPRIHEMIEILTNRA